MITAEALPTFAPQDLATTLYSLAKLSYRPRPAWMRLMEAECLAKSDNYTEQAMSITAWSALVLQTGDPGGAMLARCVTRLVRVLFVYPPLVSSPAAPRRVAVPLLLDWDLSNPVSLLILPGPFLPYSKAHAHRDP